MEKTCSPESDTPAQEKATAAVPLPRVTAAVTPVTTPPVTPDKAIKAAAVLAYQRAGLPLFPCLSKGAKNSLWKRPVYKGWQTVGADPTVAPDDLPDTFGVPLSSRLIVVDGDPRHYEDGVNELELLCDLYGLLDLDTYIVQTGTGGYHLYFKVPTGVEPRRLAGHPVVNGKPLKGVDIKTGGGYVIAAGSWHLEAGKQYTTANGDPKHIADIPLALFESLIRPDIELPGSDVYFDDETTQHAFIEHLANALPAVENKGGNNQTLHQAMRGKDLGLPATLTYEIMLAHYNPRCLPPWSEAELKGIVAHAYQYGKKPTGCANPQQIFSDDVLKELGIATPGGQEELQPDVPVRWELKATKTAELKANAPNVRNCFHAPYRQTPTGKVPNELWRLVRYNEFAQRIEFVRPAPWHGEYHPVYWDPGVDTLQLVQYLSTTRGPDFPPRVAYDAVETVALHYRYHPIREWLRSLKWDGVARVHRLLPAYCGAKDDEYTRAIGKRFMVASVARVMRPGCKHDCMLLLEGDQGIGKSTFARILGGKWFGEFHLDPHNKDVHSNLRGKWIVEEPEMDCLNRYDAGALKAFLSTSVDTYRKPYGHDAADVPRQCVFIGTINPGASGDYLIDDTGNRRYWPVSVKWLNLEGLVNDRDQLFAEALYLYDNGEQWHLTKEENIYAAEEQAKRHRHDAWDCIIADWLADAKEHGILPTALRLEHVATMALQLPTSKIDNTARKRIANAMRRCGYTSTSRSIGGVTRRVWEPEVDKTLLNGL